MTKKRKGRITDEEARIIEKELPFSNYNEVAEKIGRNPSTVRRFAQKHGITKDTISTQKFNAKQAKSDPVFKRLEEALEEDEIVHAHEIYVNMTNQFGVDIQYAERQEVIDFAILSCLIARELVTEKNIKHDISKFTEERDILNQLRIQKNNEDDIDEVDDILDKIDNIDIMLADLKEERKHAKDNYRNLMNRKDAIQKSLNVSRNQRSDQLKDASENFESLTEFLKKNPEKRKAWGLEMEKMRIAMNEEWFRLSLIHKYADGELDYPVFSPEVVEKELSRMEKEENE